MGIKEIIAKWRGKKERFSEIQTEDRLQNKLQERKLSANEREYNRYVEEDRQKKIKAALDNIHRKQRNEYNHKDTISQKPLFTGNKKLFAVGGKS